MSESAASLLTGADELFGGQGQNAPESYGAQTVEYVSLISRDLIDDCEDSPFKIRDDREMLELIENVREHGILIPTILRPKENGRFQMVSGRRRNYAAGLAGMEGIPGIIREMTDDEAIIIMVDSNLQREHILPSERAKAYKMKLDAMKRQGKRTDLTSSQDAMKLKGKQSAEILGEQVGESKDQVYRYIRLNNLIPELLDMVDEDKISIGPAEKISFLSKAEQEDLLQAMEAEDCTPSVSQAKRLKQKSQDGGLTPDEMQTILMEEKPNQREQVKLPWNRLKEYFSEDTSIERITETIFKALEIYRKRQREQRGHER